MNAKELSSWAKRNGFMTPEETWREDTVTAYALYRDAKIMGLSIALCDDGTLSAEPIYNDDGQDTGCGNPLEDIDRALIWMERLETEETA